MNNIKSNTLKRTYVEYYKKKIEKNESFLLLGPRQTGKTTLLSEVFEVLSRPKIQYLLQRPSERVKLENDPETLIQEVLALKSKTPVLIWIDEIQKVPTVFDVLQYLIDKKMIVFMGSGSSARKLRKAGQNWLPGRIHLEHFYPLSFEEKKELEHPYELEDFLLFGSLPAIVTQIDPHKRHQDLLAYTHLYLEEEIRAEALTKNIPRFSAFLKLAALESGTSPNFSKIAGVTGTTPPTIASYYQILIDTLTVSSIPSFGTKRSHTIRSPRYYFFDIGIRNSAASLFHSQGILTLQSGILFEHFILNEIKIHGPRDLSIFYWRTKTGEEVDFILEQGEKIVACEVKFTNKPKQDDYEGLLAFSKKFKIKNLILICNIDRQKLVGDILCLPWKELFSFLKQNFIF